MWKIYIKRIKIFILFIFLKDGKCEKSNGEGERGMVMKWGNYNRGKNIINIIYGDVVIVL